MSNLDREEVIDRIVSSRVQDILVPSTVFGRPMLVKTTKKDIVAKIRQEYAEGPTNLKFRLRPNTNSAIVQAFGPYTKPVKSVNDKPVAAVNAVAGSTVVRRGRGRPLGSKNKPKVVETQPTEESVAA